MSNTLKNRKFISWFDQDNIPEKKVIKSIIKKTFELVPSKQCIMPYMITVFGPEFKKEKEEIIKLTTHQHMRIEYGKNLNEQLKAPYLLIFSTRLITNPSKKIKGMIKKGIRIKVCEEDNFNSPEVKASTSLEIGMFSMILTALALEHNIDTAYTLCQFVDPRNQTIVKNHALFIMSLGYCDPLKSYKDFKDKRIKEGEIKPKMEDVIIWK